MRIKLDYGQTGLDVDLPEERLVGPLAIRPAAALADPSRASRDALDHPIGTAPLAEIARARLSDIYYGSKPISTAHLRTAEPRSPLSRRCRAVP